MSSSNIGTSIKRYEDLALLKGEGRFVDDIKIEGLLEVAFVRSPHPHAVIKSIDTGAARALDGVHAVYTHADLDAVLTSNVIPCDHKNWDFPETAKPLVLPSDEVCFAGEAIAIVVADSRYLAEDAVELVVVDYEPLPAVSNCSVALAEGAPTVHRNAKDNIVTEFLTAYGDCDKAFRDAPHVFDLSLKVHRGGAHPIETRGTLAKYDPDTDQLTVWINTQKPHPARNGLVQLFGMDEQHVRVIVPDVGGGFGGKNLLHSEDILTAVAAKLLGRSVKWIEDRRENFVAAIQERDQFWEVEIAVDQDAQIIGVRGDMLHDQGAYTLLHLHVPHNSAIAVPGPYKVPHYKVRTRVIETNCVGTIPVRGAGYPEGNFVMERLLDEVARRLELDRGEVRRRNLIRGDEIPYELPMKTRENTPIIYESGNFSGVMEQALDVAAYRDFSDRQAEARENNRYLGIGVSNMVKVTGRGPFETALVRIGRSGKVMIYTSAMPMGQGTKTTLAQICADQLGVDPGDISLVTSDTTVVPHGIGAYGSRTTVNAGNAVHVASGRVREKLLQAAQHMLKTSDNVAGYLAEEEEDLELRDGQVWVKGAAPLAISFAEIAKALSGVKGYNKPAGMAPSLEATIDFMPVDVTYGNSAHVVEVEVDPGTGDVEILRYVVVNDSGHLVNPMLVEGQLHGGVVHGIGNAMFEWMGYDESAQPVVTTFADYLLPSATEVPNIEIHHQSYPSTLNPLGVKGVGESGTVGAVAAIVSATENALEPFGVRIKEAPMSPAGLVELMADAR